MTTQRSDLLIYALVMLATMIVLSALTCFGPPFMRECQDTLAQWLAWVR